MDRIFRANASKFLSFVLEYRGWYGIACIRTGCTQFLCVVQPFQGWLLAVWDSLHTFCSRILRYKIIKPKTPMFTER